MGFVGFKLKTYFKDYKSLEENGISKVNKKYYLENTNTANEAVKKSKVSILKIICTIMVFCYILFYFYFFCTGVIFPNFHPNFPSQVNDLLDDLVILMFYSTPISAIFYFLCYFNKSIRKSNFLRIFFILYFGYYALVIINLAIGLHGVPDFD